MPVVMSIAWKKGELTGAPIPSSSGHLIVLAGFDTTGSHSAAVTTIISFVPGVKIAFIELYCSGLTKKQTFQLDAVEFTP